MNVNQRLFEDYFKRDRLKDYKKVLEAFRSSGYHMVGILDFHNVNKSGGIKGKYFINRHDIDTSPKVAREMFEIEKEVYGKEGTATYYFRDSTIDKKLIAEINNFGYETGYHYEELATYEKRVKAKDAVKIRESYPVCREMFLNDVENFRIQTGSKSQTVASHGDFINTRYRIQSFELLSDIGTREKAKIVVEAYDEVVMKYVDVRYADQVLLEKFPDEVIKGIDEGHQIIMTLTHPRNWKVDVVANTYDNIVRFWQGLIYRI